MCKFFILLFASWLVLSPGLYGAETTSTTEEETLIQVLRSDQGLDKKDAACARLKIIGTEKSIPALAVLLTNENLSHSARYALEPMSAAKAEQTLLEALKNTSGSTRVGIIGSLGIRGDTRAVPALGALLKNSDAATGTAAATALGQIGGTDAIKFLLAAFHSANDAPPKVVADGILRCANGLLAAGSQPKALAAFKELYDARNSASTIRAAAYGGMIRASGTKGLRLIESGLQGNDPESLSAALKTVAELDSPGTTKTLTSLLPKLGPPVQAALIEGLQQRNDPAAAADIAKLATSPSPEVRLAVLNALRDLGDQTYADLLAGRAASSKGEEQAAARQALVDLRRGAVTEALLKSLEKSQGGVQAEVARALGQRGEQAATPGLLALAKAGSAGSRSAALKALALLAAEAQLPAMVELVIDATDTEIRNQAAEALNTAYQRCHAKNARVSVAPLVQQVTKGTTQTRGALLPICSGLNSPQIRAVLKNSIQDKDPAVREAGARALCDTSDGELLPEVVRLAQEAKEESIRTLAIAACVRLTTQEDGNQFSNAQRLQAFKQILETPVTPAQKRQVLAGLAEVADIGAFKLAEPMIAEPAVQAEAAQALVRISAKLTGPEATETLALLRAIVDSTAGESIRKAAAQNIRQIEIRMDYVTTWKVAGPYHQAGKDFSALFDAAFPPENDGNVDWKSLSPSGNVQRPWLMDLLKSIGGEQRVAYVRTWINSPEVQPARLEIGSDDGLKVWLNHKLIHSHNTARPLEEGSDKVQVTLQKGWNELLLKITQNNLGWEFCARVLKPDGSHLDGLKFALEPAEAASSSK